MKSLKILLAVLLALLLPCFALAEGAADLSLAMPLVDLTVAAAIYQNEVPSVLGAGGVLPAEFTYNLFLLGPSMDGRLGLTEDMRQDTIAQSIWLSSAYDLGQGELTGVLSMDESFPYIGMVTMMSNVSADGQTATLVGNVYRASGRIDTLDVTEAVAVEWLDLRATVSLKRSDGAPGGWMITAFTTGDEISIEEQTAEYFADEMVEYASSKLGMSVLYPAVFANTIVEETNNGMRVTLDDGTASFRVERSERGRDTVDGLIEQLTAEGWTVTRMDAAGGLRADKTDDAGNTTVRCILISESARYEAVLTYDASHAAAFSLYAAYMVNSFSADELGIG